MDAKFIFIIILIFILLLLVFLYLDKKWIFKPKKKKVIVIKPTDKEGVCNIENITQCKCPVTYTNLENKKTTEDLNDYQIQKKFYNIRQDLMPYYSNWSDCDGYQLKKRLRIHDDTQFDLYDENNNIIEQNDVTLKDDKNYKLYSCDLIPCQNYGLNKEDKNICRIKSDGYDIDADNKFLNTNFEKCITNINFSSSSEINKGCLNNGIGIPLQGLENITDNDIYNIKNRIKTYRNTKLAADWVF